MITSVEQIPDQLPKEYFLDQNYPNPFNPSTTITFSLPHSGYVTIRVFNSLGQDVATLVSEDLVAGSYKTRWDASGLGSGIYVYRLTTMELMATRKMVLMK